MSTGEPSLRWEGDPPSLRQPTMIAAFEGWNDAADAASGAVAWLRHRLHAARFAWLEPDEYYDFQATRPSISLSNGVVSGLR